MYRLCIGYVSVILYAGRGEIRETSPSPSFKGGERI